jgi:hypothetical protein
MTFLAARLRHDFSNNHRRPHRPRLQRLKLFGWTEGLSTAAPAGMLFNRLALTALCQCRLGYSEEMPGVTAPLGDGGLGKAAYNHVGAVGVGVG